MLQIGMTVKVLPDAEYGGKYTGCVGVVKNYYSSKKKAGVELEKEKLDTRFEEAQRAFDENKEPRVGFSIEDIAKKLLGDDYTEDWYPEEEQERDRRNMVISSYKDNNEMERLLMML